MYQAAVTPRCVPQLGYESPQSWRHASRERTKDFDPRGEWYEIPESPRRAPQKTVAPQPAGKIALDRDLREEPDDQSDQEFESDRVVSAKRVLKGSQWYRTVHAGHNESPFSPAPLRGNIYRYWAITWPGRPSASSLFACCMWRSWAGLVAVMMVQVLGPIAILHGAMYKLDSSSSFVFIGMCPKEQGLNEIMTRLLSILFLYGFIAKSYTALSEEVVADKKMHVLFIRMYRMDAYVFHRSWIVIGAAINCWVSVVSCIAMWFVFHLAEGPKDVIFDALGLAFLVNLGNVSGEMGVISESHWNEIWMGVFWHDLVKIRVRHAPMPVTYTVDAVRERMTSERPRDLNQIIQSERFVDNVLNSQEERLDEAADMEDELGVEDAYIFHSLKRRASSYRFLSYIYCISMYLIMVLLLILPISFALVSKKQDGD